MKISILGTGKVAHTLGASWAAAGHSVTLGARTGTATDPDFAVQSLQDALDSGDVVVNALTGAVALEVITSLDTSSLAGKTLIDATNAVSDEGQLVYPNSSLAEHLQAAVPAAHVVKSLNTAAIEVQAEPSLIGPATVFLSGDDPASKDEVRGLLHDLGWRNDGIIDLGGIETARGPEHYIVLFFATIGAFKNPMFNLRIERPAVAH